MASDFFTGYNVNYYRRQLINTGYTNHLIHDIKVGNVSLVFIELPAKGKHVQEDRHTAFWTTICYWARLAKDVGAQLMCSEDLVIAGVSH